MKASDARTMTVDQPTTRCSSSKRRNNLRFQRATSQLEHLAGPRGVAISRMKTIARQKRAGEEPKVQPAASSAKPEPKIKRSAKARAPVKSRSKPSLKSRAKSKSKK
jgi:ribosomal protein L29